MPVTIVSRCQRFDLSRVNSEELFKFIKEVKNKENGKINDEAIKLIVKISEGSVRDAVSLLDRSLISQSISKSGNVEEDDVRKMLGLADRSKILFLFK